MAPRVRRPAALAVALVLALVAGGLLAPRAASAQEGPAPADMVLTNANVYTADNARPTARAVAVRDGRVVFVGSAAEARALTGRATRVLDLDGRTVIPGMIDSHGHFSSLGNALRNVDLVGTRSLEEVVERVAARAREVPEGTWIRGRGWDQNEWGDTRFPVHDALSQAVPDHPVVLGRVDGHALFANARAMELAGVERDTPDPDGGRIVRDAQGDATGVFVDRAQGLIYDVVPPPGRDEIREAILLAQEELNRVGLTSVHDAGVGRETVEVFEDLAREGLLTVRNYVMVSSDPGTLDHYLSMGPRDDVAGNGFLQVKAIKMVADGALGSRGAALLEPYSDEPEHRGLVIQDHDDILSVARRALDTGFQLNVHAIGDRANRIALDAFEAALAEHPAADHRFRIEHAQIIHRHDLPRFAELGVLPSMQAIHQASDMSWVPNRLGYNRLLGTYAWRYLIDSGVVIPGGSDFPVESPDPLLSFHAAVTRQNADDWPVGGWFPEQVMTRDEALLHMTLWGAYGAFMEDELGSITPGKRADIVVLDRDIMTVPADEILDASVVMTIVDGRVVYDAGATPRTRTEDGGR